MPLSGVALEGNLTATFSEAMNTATISATTFTLAGPGTTAVTGVVSLSDDGLTATFNPASNLAGSTLFTATITTGAQDLAGNALASSYVWTFTTGAAPDTTPPTVSSTVPAASATGVAIGGNVTATFSEAMNTATITGTTFTLAGPGTTAVAGAVTYTGTTGDLQSQFNDLLGSTVYTATITTGSDRIWRAMRGYYRRATMILDLYHGRDRSSRLGHPLSFPRLGRELRDSCEDSDLGYCRHRDYR